ncbi:MAG TPA: hypothetical protein VKD08_08035, partial [Ignavibacteriaceae bacterium]|nr:hypothetical protein [Ignavibacteriaceae bacterium]
MKFDLNFIKYPFLLTAYQTAVEMDQKVYIVGGFVRDKILGRERNEIDFLVTGSGIDFVKKFSG